VTDFSVEKRLFERNDAFSTIRFLTPAGEMEGVIEDFSIGGLGVRVDGPLPHVGLQATILFPEFGGILSEVVHATGNQVGLRFTDTPERIGELMHAVKKRTAFS